MVAALSLLTAGCTTPASAPPPAAPIATLRLSSGWVVPGSPPLAIMAFTESGLPPGRSVTIVASADSLTGFDCIDQQGRLMGRSTPLTSQVSSIRVFTADSGGGIRGAILIAPPPPSGIGCPGGSRPYPVSALYTNGVLSDVSNRADVRLAGQSGRAPGVQDR